MFRVLIIITLLILLWNGTEVTQCDGVTKVSSPPTSEEQASSGPVFE